MKANSLRVSLWLGGALLFGLLVLSLLYWQERVIMVDAAFQVFSVLLDDGFAIQVQRFAAVIVQIFPYLARELNLPLATALQSYSIAFTLYPLLLFVLLVWGLRQYRMALALVFFYGLLQIHTFYWIQSELLIACALTYLLLGIVHRFPNPNYLGMIGIFGLLGGVLYAHPLAIVAVLYGWGFLCFESTIRKGKLFWFIPLSIVVIMLYKNWIAPVGGYDATALSMFDGFEERLPEFFSLTSTQFFVKRLIGAYYLFPLALVSILAFYVWKRWWWKAAWVMMTAGGWIVLILTTYHWVTQHFYIESYYMMLALFAGLPLAWDIWPQFSRNWIGPSLMVVILVIRLSQIVDAREGYADRLAWNKTQLAAMENYEEHRFVTTKAEVPMYTLHLEWAVPYEMVLLSSLNGPTQSLIIVGEEAQVSEVQKIQEGMPNPWGQYPYNWLNNGPYFHMTDTLPVRRFKPVPVLTD